MKINHFKVIWGEHYIDAFGRKRTRYFREEYLGFSEGQAKQKFFHSSTWFSGRDIWISSVIRLG